MKARVNTIYQLANYINANEDYPLDVEDIIRANGWRTEPGREDIICKTLSGDVLYIDDNGRAIVR